MFRAHTSLVAAVVGCATLAVTAAAQPPRPWEAIDRERGIEISRREEPGRSLPTMRGRGKIRGDVLSALAVILDVERGTEWAEGADEAYVVKRESDAVVLYTLTKLAWPVSDREMVCRRRVKVIQPGKEYLISYSNAPKARPPNDDAVRVPDGSLFFHIKQVDAGHLWMEYQVNVDPGGALPKWLVRWASKKIPLKTFLALEAQIDKTKGEYADVKARWATGP